MSHVLSAEGTKAPRLNLPAGFYVVEMAVQNEEETRPASITAAFPGPVEGARLPR